jgi:hypothetical protein
MRNLRHKLTELDLASDISAIAASEMLIGKTTAGLVDIFFVRTLNLPELPDGNG